MDPSQPDDVDRLFARLEAVPPPADLHAQVMTAVAVRSRRRRVLGAGLAVASLACMLLFSFLAGQQLGASGAILLLRELVFDSEIARAAPTDAALAAAELVPWAYVAAVLAGVAGVVLAARSLLQPAASLAAGRRDGGR